MAYVEHTDPAGEIDQLTAVDIDHNRPPGLSDEGGGNVEGALRDVLLALLQQIVLGG
jgi:hypothetical protein